MTFAFYSQYFLGILNSSTFSTFLVLDRLCIDVPTTDLLLRKHTQHTNILHRMTCMILIIESHFELQLRDCHEARRRTFGVGGVGLL